ncbi:MAG: hypothetical protein R2762_01105 [Bryobacteraceae bacterium]
MTSNDTPAKARALRGFLASEVALAETGKVLQDRYRDVDFDTLAQALAVSCKKKALRRRSGRWRNFWTR